jgi:hypothetical protein
MDKRSYLGEQAIEYVSLRKRVWDVFSTIEAASARELESLLQDVDAAATLGSAVDPEFEMRRDGAKALARERRLVEALLGMRRHIDRLERGEMVDAEDLGRRFGAAGAAA